LICPREIIFLSSSRCLPKFNYHTLVCTFHHFLPLVRHIIASFLRFDVTNFFLFLVQFMSLILFLPFRESTRKNSFHQKIKTRTKSIEYMKEDAWWIGDTVFYFPVMKCFSSCDLLAHHGWRWNKATTGVWSFTKFRKQSKFTIQNSRQWDFSKNQMEVSW